jgi:hypothetical protein
MSKGDKLATQTQNSQVPSFVLGEPPNIFDFPVVLHTGTWTLAQCAAATATMSENNRTTRTKTKQATYRDNCCCTVSTRLVASQSKAVLIKLKHNWRCVAMPGTSRDMFRLSLPSALAHALRWTNLVTTHLTQGLPATSGGPIVQVLLFSIWHPRSKTLCCTRKNGRPVTAQCPPQSAQTALSQLHATAPTHNADGINAQTFGRVTHNARVRSKLSRQYSKQWTPQRSKLLAHTQTLVAQEKCTIKIQHECSILKQPDVSAETRSLRSSGKQIQ